LNPPTLGVFTAADETGILLKNSAGGFVQD
jgi:hypothetical protein